MLIRVIKFDSKPKNSIFVSVNWLDVWKTSSKLIVPKKKNIKKIAIARPKSPILLTINAFIAALLAVSFLYQKPINKYEHKPTPSHPKNSCKKLSETTKASIEKVNSERYDINLGL